MGRVGWWIIAAMVRAPSRVPQPSLESIRPGSA